MLSQKLTEKKSRPTRNKSGITTKQVETVLKTIRPVEPVVEDYYKCCTCGKKYTKQQGNFSYSQSPLFKGNNSFLPICNHCLENLVEQYTEILGDQNKAIERVCLHWDMYLSESALNAAKKVGAGMSRIRNYVKNCNLTQNAGKTYDTYLEEIKSNTIDTYEDFEKAQIDAELNNETVISERTIKRWGLGYTETEYQMLNEHYKMLKDKAGNDDVKESLIKDLCEQNVLKYRARQENDIDRYEKISKLYQSTLASADLKPKDTSKNTNINNPDECWGNYIAMVENFSPAEFFKNKDIFKDFNGIEDYCDRHIKRSTNNLINGTNVRDVEFNVEEGDSNNT